MHVHSSMFCKVNLIFVYNTALTRGSVLKVQGQPCRSRLYNAHVRVGVIMPVVLAVFVQSNLLHSAEAPTVTVEYIQNP